MADIARWPAEREKSMLESQAGLKQVIKCEFELSDFVVGNFTVVQQLL